MSEPITFDTDEEETGPRPRKTAFVLDGTEFTVPDTFTAAEGLLFVGNVRKWGVDAATEWALEYALDSEGYAVLMGLGTDSRFTESWMKVVNAIVSDISGGRYQAAPGKGQANGSTRKSSQTKRRSTRAS